EVFRSGAMISKLGKHAPQIIRDRGDLGVRLPAHALVDRQGPHEQLTCLCKLRGSIEISSRAIEQRRSLRELNACALAMLGRRQCMGKKLGAFVPGGGILALE